MIKVDDFTYADAFGTALKGVIALPDPALGTVPGILVVHDAFGLGNHTIEQARKLAGQGYVALAVDMFGDRRTAKDLPGGLALIDEVTASDGLQIARIAAGLSALKGHARVDPVKTGAIGYCFGGATVLELARSGADVTGVVSFHGTLEARKRASTPLTSAFLVCHGDADPIVPPEQVRAFEQEMRSRACDWQVHIYGGARHGFTNPRADDHGIAALGYDACADRRSWTAMTLFFEDLFAR